MAAATAERTTADPTRTAGWTTVPRIAPTGAPVELSVPVAFGEHRWYANTRFTGPGLARQFFLAPAGEHRAVPTHVLPGARERRVPVRGFDALVFEAPDRSDAALVLAGPYHEATTWFGGPAPDEAGVAALLSAFRFTDHPAGATLVPVADLLVAQTDVTVIGRSPRSTLIVRRAVDALASLPAWAGLRLPGGELWRAGRVLPPSEATLVAGTAHQWRYLIAGDSVAMDLVLHGPESGQPPLPMSADDLVATLTGLAGRWVG
jgi:hypothetical protein